MSDKMDEMLKALQTYTDSIKLGSRHAVRIVYLVNRIEVLGALHKELVNRLMVEHESIKEYLDAGGDPASESCMIFQAHYNETQVLHKLILETAAEAQEEKGFIDWHMESNIVPEYNEAMKRLKGENEGN